MQTIAILDTVTGETTLATVVPFKGFYDTHVDAYRDEQAFAADPIRYREDQDYRAGTLFNH